MVVLSSWEGFLDVLNALRCSENTGNVDMFRIALGEEKPSYPSPC